LISNIRISTDGSIKIGEHDLLHLFKLINCVPVLDLEQYGRKASDESLRLAHALLDLPYMAEIVEEMLLLRYRPDDDEALSKDALDFVSCCLSGSIESLMKVSNLPDDSGITAYSSASFPGLCQARKQACTAGTIRR
jgi:hypothetical protein